jgi:HAD superfamily hydrolase (TIGR01509 family)
VTREQGRRFDGVLLDVDGTLVDTNRLHAQAWFDAFNEAGLDGGTVLDIQRLVGMGSDKLIPAAVGLDPESSEAKRLAERRAQIFKELYLPTVRPTHGARELVEALRDRGFRLAVASSARENELRGLLDAAGLGWLAERAVAADHVKASKPEPDVIEKALEEAGVPAERAVLIGDTPYDVEAATKAGVAMIGLRCGGWDEIALKGAIAVYEDPADLLRHLDESPLAG